MAELLATSERWKEIRSEDWSYAGLWRLRATLYAGSQIFLSHSSILYCQILRIFCVFQRFLYALQARHSYFCIPRNLRAIWCPCTEKFYHMVVRNSLELCSFQKKLGRLMACIMHVSMTQHFHIMCSASKKHWIYSTYSAIKICTCTASWTCPEMLNFLSICRLWGKHLLLLPLDLQCMHNVLHVFMFLCGNTWAELGGNKQVFKAVEN